MQGPKGFEIRGVTGYGWGLRTSGRTATHASCLPNMSVIYASPVVSALTSPLCLCLTLEGLLPPLLRQNHNIYYDLAMLVALLAGGAAAWVAWVQASERLKRARKAARKAAGGGKSAPASGAGSSRPRRQRVQSSGALSTGSGAGMGGSDSDSDEAGGGARADQPDTAAPGPSGSLLLQPAKPAGGSAAAAMREWSAEELRLLDKGLKKFPVVRAPSPQARGAHGACEGRVLSDRALPQVG